MKRGTVAVGFLDDHRWSACFGLSLRDLYLRDQVSESPRILTEGALELRKVAGTGGIPEARNQVASLFLDSDREWLFFIDTDMGFDPDAVDRLIASADEHRRPVMGGLCFANRRLGPAAFHAERFGSVPTLYNYVQLDTEVGFAPIQDYPRDEVVEVAGTGAACLLIHRRALSKVRQKFGPVWFEPISHPEGLTDKATGEKSKRTFSEDLSFCVRLAAVGVPVFVDTSVKTCHEKQGVFLNEEHYDREQALAAFEAAVRADTAAAPEAVASESSAA